jgi:DNA-binding winged helix-turn-helix (wHTH) protein
MAYRFGPFLYDPVSHGLLREGAEIPLTHKSRELLLLFLHNPGRLLAREEIVERLWPDVAVTDDALRFQLTELRKAFGGDGDTFIRTIRREGYRWEAPIRGEAHRPTRSAPSNDEGRQPEARHRLVLESREVPRLEGENVIGRDPDAALWIDHPSVSRRHARVVIANGKVKLEDLGSKNGTLLNGKRIRGSRPLADGDQIQIGRQTMVFRAMSQLGTTQTERRT